MEPDIVTIKRNGFEKMGKLIGSITTLAVASILITGGCSDEPITDQKAQATPLQRVLDDGAEQPAKQQSFYNPDCISYGEWRTTVTSDGPPFPLPVFSPDIERRCVSAFEDYRTYYIDIWPDGEKPKTVGDELAFNRIPKTDSPGAAPEDRTILISGAVALGGQANADAMLAKNWNVPSVTMKGSVKQPHASWRSVTIDGVISEEEATRAIGSLKGQWLPLRPDAKNSERLDGMNVAARWDALDDGQFVFAEVGRETADSVFVLMEKKGRAIQAIVIPAQGDSASCYQGKLSAAGKMTDLRFVDPLFGGDEGRPAIQRVGDTWPDHLVTRPLRRASFAVRKRLQNNNASLSVCREAFLHPDRIGMPDS